MNKKVSRQDLATLKKLVKKLPPTYDLADQQVIYQLNNARALMEKHRYNIVPEAGSDPVIIRDKITISLTDQRIWPVNHLRRMRRAFENGGVPAVDQYIKWVDKNNKALNDFLSRKIVFETAKEISVL